MKIMNKETKKQKLERLSKEAVDMDCELYHLEGRLYDIVDDIKKLKPNKKEIEEYDLQYLFDCYSI